jgi:REP element-mobilizing transposase RayT
MLNFETYYHIYNHANGNENLFVEDKNYKFFLEKYYLHLNPVVETIAWCLMPNHFHLLEKVKSEDEIYSAFPKFQTLENLKLKSNFISKQFSNFCSSYTQSFNKVYKRRGSLFLKNFKRKEIDSEDYLRNLII